MPDSKPVIMPPRATAFTRVITTRPVTFTCVECGNTYTVEQYPGPSPTVCETCWPERRRRQKRDAARRRRERERLRRG
jgi:hypothetical protein